MEEDDGDPHAERRLARLTSGLSAVTWTWVHGYADPAPGGTGSRLLMQITVMRIRSGGGYWFSLILWFTVMPTPAAGVLVLAYARSRQFVFCEYTAPPAQGRSSSRRWRPPSYRAAPSPPSPSSVYKTLSRLRVVWEKCDFCNTHQPMPTSPFCTP